MAASDFVEIVAQLRLSEGNAAFDQWLQQHGLNRTNIADDIRQDIIRGADGKTYTRYWVRKSVVDKFER